MEEKFKSIVTFKDTQRLRKSYIFVPRFKPISCIDIWTKCLYTVKLMKLFEPWPPFSNKDSQSRAISHITNILYSADIVLLKLFRKVRLNK